MNTSPDRQTFRALVADVAARAKARLPEAVNGRVESASKLVLLGDVMPQEDGSILVGSSSDPMKSYLLAGDACECQDWQHGKAPGGWCQHRIAAGIHKRVGELLAVQTPAPVTLPEAMEVWADNDFLELEPEVVTKSDNVPVNLQGPQGLGEAPASVTVRVTISGSECQITLRDSDEGRLLERLEAVLQRFPVEAQAPPQGSNQLSAQQHNALAQGQKITGVCPIHSVPMKENHKDGRTWWSHRTADGQWCKGR